MNTSGSMARRIRQELSLLSRFSLVGIVATAVHMSVVWFLISRNGMSPYAANVIAFLMAFMVSFSGQYYWTFVSTQHWRVAFARFFLLSGTAFLFNNLLLASILSANILSAALATVLAAGSIPVFTYFLARYWALK